MDNLLEYWYKETKYLSSPLHIKPAYKIATLDAMYQALKGNFPDKFFKPNVEENLENANWILYLLAAPGHLGSVYALQEVCQLIEFYHNAKIQEPEFVQRFNSLIDDPPQLRNFFFELYTYRFFGMNNVPMQINPIDGNQVLEGYVYFNEVRFMFECRDITMPHLQKVYLQKHAEVRIVEEFKALQYNTGMVGIVRFNNPLQGNIKEVFNKKLRKFMHFFKNPIAGQKLYYKDEDDDALFEVIPYDQHTRSLYQNTLHKYHVLFCVVPPHTVVMNEPNHYTISVEARSDFDTSVIKKKFEQVLKEKRSQHKERSKRIFIFSSEAINDLYLPIFKMRNVITDEYVQKHYLHKYKEDDILIFIIRDFTTNQPKTEFKIYTHPAYDHIKKQIEKFILKPNK